ncbi:MAG: DHA2 family efflux MFS transporter permease subunit [Steroidobacteraceae bacterium]|nr:DHA2 family efflux MFS transporter permease subunit [Steroidobacteraceae bacterium]
MSAKAAIGSPARPVNRVLITASVMAASIMQAIDTTIANIALPRMQGSLSGTQDQMVWVLTSYIVATAIMTPLAAWLAVRVGRKRVFFTSVISFTIASALCGMATSLAEIVVFRTFQGLAGAALLPLSQAILLDINPKERHGRAMAIWGMGVVLGPIVGPLLGGWLTEDYSWRWVFLVNVPFGILAAIGIAATLPETQPKRSTFDLFGFAMLSIGVGALQLMLDRGELKDWFASTEIRIEALVATLGLFLFIAHMLTTEHPFISRALFKDRNFVIGNVFIFMVGTVLFATLALLPAMMQGLMGYPVLTAGLVMAPRGVGTWVAMAVVGRLAGRVDARWLIAVGFGLAAISLAQMAALSPQTDAEPLITSGVLQGFGSGLAYVALTIVSFVTLPAHLRDEGAAFFNLTRNIGSSIGISCIQAYVTSGTSRAHAHLTEQLTPFNAAAVQQQVLQPLDTTAGIAALNHVVDVQAGWIAYVNAFHVMMLLTVVVIPLILFARGAKQGRKASQVAPE